METSARSRGPATAWGRLTDTTISMSPRRGRPWFHIPLSKGVLLGGSQEAHFLFSHGDRLGFNSACISVSLDDQLPRQGRGCQEHKQSPPGTSAESRGRGRGGGRRVGVTGPSKRHTQRGCTPAQVWSGHEREGAAAREGLPSKPPQGRPSHAEAPGAPASPFQLTPHSLGAPTYP